MDVISALVIGEKDKNRLKNCDFSTHCKNNKEGNIKSFDIGKNRFDLEGILKIGNSKEILLKHLESLIDGIDLSNTTKSKFSISNFMTHSHKNRHLKQ